MRSPNAHKVTKHKLKPMDENLRIIKNQFKKHKGQYVINHGVVQRLIAIGTDDSDYYYIFWDGRKTIWSTCVGTFVPLKGKIEDKHYNEFGRIAKLNDYDFLGELDTEKWVWTGNADEVKMKVENINGPDRYLTEVCWDLN